MKNILGAPIDPTPSSPPSDYCYSQAKVNNPRMKKLIVTSNVGPFSATGLKPFVETITKIFAEVKQKDPNLYTRIGSAGLLCVRPKKNPNGSYRMGSWSNHSWGVAIDIKMNGKLDTFGDGCTISDLQKIYPYFHQESFYWGAGYSGGREDSMHFEASQELLQKWKTQGLLN
jgi:hypothetical protein